MDSLQIKETLQIKNMNAANKKVNSANKKVNPANKKVNAANKKRCGYMPGSRARSLKIDYS